MALFLVTGPRGSGKSTLIRNMGGVEHVPSSIGACDRLIGYAKEIDIWATTNEPQLIERLRPHVAREYIIRLP